ncbi:hypothetical protein C8Q80DRAFT_1351650 [Daedaleopsis nitida]|nr:hypothetical protein C8Q80DRAFT_1351650 [Daedaleopsis nitida]
MVSTGWRTASTVIIIVVGAALLTFAIFIYRRQKMLREGLIAPDMQQRYMDSYAGDPEAHTPLLFPPESVPPLPPKTEPFLLQRSTSSFQILAHQRNGSSVGSVRDREDRVGRVPVPPMFPEPSIVSEQRRSLHGDSKAPAVPFPELSPAPAYRQFLFPLANLQFPRIQIKSDGTKRRFPSLRIEFLREHNQVISSPGEAYNASTTRQTPPPSSTSAPSTYSRPFATMGTSPVPQVPPLPSISPIYIARQSPSTVSNRTTNGSAPNSAADSVLEADEYSSPASVQSVGQGLFSRKLSTEDASFQTVSRNSSTRPVSDPGRPSRTFSTSSRSSLSNPNSNSSSGSSVGAPLRRTTTWVPNVMASYSPWHGVVSQARYQPGGAKDAGDRPESPTGELRVADAYRPMPTVQETPELTPATLPSSLPEAIPPYMQVPSPSYLSEEAASTSAHVPGAAAPSSPSYFEDDAPLPLPPQLAGLSSPPPPPRLDGVDSVPPPYPPSHPPPHRSES